MSKQWRMLRRSGMEKSVRPVSRGGFLLRSNAGGCPGNGLRTSVLRRRYWSGIKVVGLMIGIIPWFLNGETSPDILSRYIENMKKITSIRAKMSCEIKQGEQYSYMKGEYLSKGSKLFFKVRPPFDFELVTNGKKAFFYMKRDKTVYLYDPTNYPREYAKPVEEQTKEISRMHDLKCVGKDSIGWQQMEIYEGTPRDLHDFVSKTRLWIEPKTGLLFRMESYDLHNHLINRVDMNRYQNFQGIWFNLESKNWTKESDKVIEMVTQFQDLELNGELSDSLFEFSLPAGVKTRDLTERIEKNRSEAEKKNGS